MLIGKIPYLNCVPFFAALRRDGLQFIEASPRDLGLMMARGELDAGPVPTAEWLRRRAEYEIAGDWGICCDGPSMSVLLFSKVPFEELTGRRVNLSTHSTSSVALLKRLCRARNVTPIWKEGLGPKDCDAELTIGDRALIERPKFEKEGHLVYDLSEMWKVETGLPFAFAVWAIRKSLPAAQKADLAARLRESVDQTMALLGAVARLESGARGLPETAVAMYLRNFIYRLTPTAYEGIRRFESEIESYELLREHIG